LRTLWWLLALLFLGVVAKAYRQARPAFDPGVYAKTDSLFKAATARLHDASGTPPVENEGGIGGLDSSAGGRASLEALFLSGGKVDINTATQQELEGLPRIGPKTAALILEHRTRYGPFRSTEDLMNVRGIGEKTFERLADRITVE
jgi:competence ComEA-like helix-hairpin-helix protein